MFGLKINPSREKERKITSLKLDKDLPDNSISTSKYNLINFFPKNLFE